MLDFILIWIIIPGIIVVLPFLNVLAIACIQESTAKTSAIAGSISGFVAFIVYVWFTLQELRIPDFTPKSYVQFDALNVLYLLSGVLVGYLLMVGMIAWKSVREAGLVTFGLTVASSFSLFSYFLIQPLRVVVSLLSLGVILGFLAYIARFPAAIKDLNLRSTKILGLNLWWIVGGYAFVVFLAFFIAAVAIHEKAAINIHISHSTTPVPISTKNSR